MLAVFAGLPTAFQVADAAPKGKAWIPREELHPPGFDRLLAQRLELLPSGAPKLIAAAVVGATGAADAMAFDWEQGSWVKSWQMVFDPIFLHPVDAPVGRYPLVFVGGQYPITSQNFYWAEVIEGQPTVPERIATTSRPFEVNYSGATRGSRRWAAIQDNFENNGFLRLFISDTPNVWNEIPVTVPTSSGVSLLSLDDSTALVVWASNQYATELRWGLLSGNGLITTDERLTNVFPYDPRLRRHPDGGAWLTWGTNENMGAIRRFESGVWQPVERLPCNYTTDPFGVTIGQADMSRDTAVRPVVVWSYQSFLDGSGGLCVCIPNDSGWDVGEEFFRGSNDARWPSAAQDRNGDTWLAWSERTQPLRWTHTYTKATASTPQIDVDTGRPRVFWTLSEAAPKSWWAVLRQKAGSDYEVVARFQAGPGLEMSWIDQEHRAGTIQRGGVSYRVRRESVDSRYEFLTPVATWTPSRRHLQLSVRHEDPIGDALMLELRGATGSRVELTIYDVTGRVIQQREVQMSGGEGSQTFPLSLGATRLPAGMYFARARDEAGLVSQGVKFVRLR